MTKQRNRPGIGLYFAILLVLLCAYYVFFGASRAPDVSFAQVRDLFQREQVHSFVIQDGDELYLALRDGTTVHNELGSTELFWE